MLYEYFLGFVKDFIIVFKVLLESLFVFYEVKMFWIFLVGEVSYYFIVVDGYLRKVYYEGWIFEVEMGLGGCRKYIVE